MSLIDFTLSRTDQLSMVDLAIDYAVTVTNNALYDAGINSPYRVLLEAQVYIYNEFVKALRDINDELNLMFLEMMGISIKEARASIVRLKFELQTYSNNAVYFSKGFPIRANNGIIFATDNVLTIPSGSLVGYVSATALTEGTIGNMPENTITQPLQAISVPFNVTNPSRSYDGLNGENISDARFRLSQIIQKRGLVTKRDYEAFLYEQNPNIISSVYSPSPNTIQIFVNDVEGLEVSTQEKERLESLINQYKPLGLNEILIDSIEILTVFVEVVGAVKTVTEAKRIASSMNSILREYLRPNNPRQIDENVKGVIILNEIERQLGTTEVDYIQSVRIGLDPESAYGQNFVFNPINQRVNLGNLRVNLTKDTTTQVYDFTN